MAKPLQGITVVDLSRLIPGPFCSLILSDLGAKVTVLDDPKRRDYLRDVGPRLSHDKGFLFEAFNRGKKRIRLTLQTQRGQKQFVRLLKNADVLIESYRPGVLARLGFSNGVLRDLNPHLVVASLTGFGQTGPLKNKAGHDLNYLSLSGMLEGGRVPLTQWSDLVGGGLFAALQIVAALRGKKPARPFTHLDISLTHNMMFLGLARLTMAQLGLSIPLLEGTLARYRTYETADGKFVALAALEAKFYNEFCDRMNHPEWKDESETYPDAAVAFHREFEKLFKSKTRAQWDAFATQYDFCLTPVLSPAEVSAHEIFRQGLPLRLVGQHGKKVALPVFSPKKVKVSRKSRS